VPSAARLLDSWSTCEVVTSAYRRSATLWKRTKEPDKREMYRRFVVICRGRWFDDLRLCPYPYPVWRQAMEAIAKSAAEEKAAKEKRLVHLLFCTIVKHSACRVSPANTSPEPTNPRVIREQTFGCWCSRRRLSKNHRSLPLNLWRSDRKLAFLLLHSAASLFTLPRREQQLHFWDQVDLLRFPPAFWCRCDMTERAEASVRALLEQRLLFLDRLWLHLSLPHAP
jgi:hypothetical protein